MASDPGPFREFSNDEFRARLDRVQSGMRDEGIDLMLVADRQNYRYITGHYSDFWWNKARSPHAWVPAEGDPILIVQAVETGWAAEASWCADIREAGELLANDSKPMGQPDFGFERDILKISLDAAKSLGASGQSVIALPSGSHMRVDMSLQVIDALREMLGKSPWVDASPILWRARMVKSQQEIEYLRRASMGLSRAYATTIEWMRPGMTELKVAAFMRAQMLLEGAEEFAYTAVDDVRVQALFSPSDRKVADRTLYLLDGGSSVHGYVTDFSRMVSMGEPTKEEQKTYEVVVDGHYAGIDAAREGATAADVAEAMYKILRKGGASDVGVGRCGHGTGLEQPEPPSLTPADQTLLVAGMVLSVEPIAYFDDVGWVFNEDLVAVRKNDPAEILTDMPTPRTLLRAGQHG